jgi:hypothetical protein
VGGQRLGHRRHPARVRLGAVRQPPNGVAVLSRQHRLPRGQRGGFLNHARSSSAGASATTASPRCRTSSPASALGRAVPRPPLRRHGGRSRDPEGGDLRRRQAFVRATTGPATPWRWSSATSIPAAKELAEKYLTKWSDGAAAAARCPRPPRRRGAQGLPGRSAQGHPGHRAHRLPHGRQPPRAAARLRLWPSRWPTSGPGRCARSGRLLRRRRQRLSHAGRATHMMLGGAITNKYVGQSVQRCWHPRPTWTATSSTRSTSSTSAGRWPASSSSSSPAATGSPAPSSPPPSTAGPPTSGTSYPERLAAATRQDVRAVMKNCVGPRDHQHLGDAAAIAPQIKATAQAGSELRASRITVEHSSLRPPHACRRRGGGLASLRSPRCRRARSPRCGRGRARRPRRGRIFTLAPERDADQQALLAGQGDLEAAGLARATVRTSREQARSSSSGTKPAPIPWMGWGRGGRR